MMAAPKPLPDLMDRMPQVRGRGAVQAGEIAAMLVSSRQALAYLPGAPGDPALADTSPVRELNRALTDLRHPEIVARGFSLATRLGGSGLRTGFLEMLTYRACLDGLAPDPLGIARYVAARARATRAEIKTVTGATDDAAVEAELANGVRAVLAERLPLWRQLGVL